MIKMTILFNGQEMSDGDQVAFIRGVGTAYSTRHLLVFGGKTERLTGWNFLLPTDVEAGALMDLIKESLPDGVKVAVEITDISTE